MERQVESNNPLYSWVRSLLGINEVPIHSQAGGDDAQNAAASSDAAASPMSAEPAPGLSDASPTQQQPAGTPDHPPAHRSSAPATAEGIQKPAADGESPVPSPSEAPLSDSAVTWKADATGADRASSSREAEPGQEQPAAAGEPEKPPSPSFFATRSGQGRFFRFNLFQMAGSPDHGYEDAIEVDPDKGIAAIADGATQGGLSDIVARSLVMRFSESSCLEEEEVRRQWWLETRRQWFLAFSEAMERASSVHQIKLDRGGASTFTAIRMPTERTYRLYHVGDCTLFWFREGRLVLVEGETKHTSHPNGLNSKRPDDASRLLYMEEMGLPGDTAVLASDAFAKWLLARLPADSEGEASGHGPAAPPWVGDLEHFTADDFSQMIERAQQDTDGEPMEQDDYTVCVLRFDGIVPSTASEPEIPEFPSRAIPAQESNAA